MQRKYYIQELTKIRTLAKEFAHDYPSLAPMLAEDATDPDVERLLEGVAYLTANVHEKLDQQLPQLSKSLCSVFFPECLTPVPSSVMMQFTALANATHALPINTGAEFASQLVDGVNCKFSLMADELVEPITLLNSQFKELDDGSHCLQLDLSMLGTTLSRWSVDELPFFIAGEQEHASDLYLYLKRYCKSIGLQGEGEAEFKLTADQISSNYIKKQSSKIASQKTHTKLNTALQDYLVFPQAFLRPCITGLSKWHNRGNGKQFSIRFYFGQKPSWLTADSSARLLVNTFPAINQFHQDADPIHLNYERSEYPIYIAGYESNQYAICNVNSVESLRPHSSSALHAYHSMEQELYKQCDTKHLYSLHYEFDDLNNKVKFAISFCDSDVESKAGSEIISTNVTLCNAALPTHLLPGQVDQGTYGTPENVEFKNVHVPSKYYSVNLDDLFRWRLISLLSYNYIAEADLTLLKEIIMLRADLLVGYNKDVLEKKLAAIKNYRVTSSSQLSLGSVLAGYDVQFTCQLSGFLTVGEVFKLGEMLILFLASSLPLNTFVRMAIHIAETGEEIEWPARTIDQILA